MAESIHWHQQKWGGWDRAWARPGPSPLKNDGYFFFLPSLVYLAGKHLEADGNNEL